MNYIIEFYNGLDALNTIIFWGIIIVILLLIVFTILMINKRKRLKKLTNSNKFKDEFYSDEIALPSNSRDTLIMKDENLLIQGEKQNNFEPFVLPEEPDNHKTIEVEKNFKAEEHVMKYDHELFNISGVKKNSDLRVETTNKEQITEKPSFNMPTKPYERNVLREMSLSQTSPIGIVKRDEQTTKQIRALPENESLILTKEALPQNNQLPNKSAEQINRVSINEVATPKKKDEINYDQTNLNQISEKNIITNNSSKNTTESSLKKSSIGSEVSSLTSHNSHQEVKITKKIPEPTLIKEKKSNYENSSLNDYPKASHIQESVTSSQKFTPIIEKSSTETLIKNTPEVKHENAKFLEEVSQKLAEADIPDEIDRTDYELQQEEDAIISYKELMAKKDTIKTIDEEDAIISIQELTKRHQQEEKLYNLTENEENNEFIDELKKFRNDLN